MAISSVSKIYDAPDPIMETDLDLLAKVNQFQQQKFDDGAREVQNEINNWSAMSNVAKEQDRQYINTKLNNLVNGINNLGGVKLSDINNVNAIKGLGYNIYGDNKIINAVTTSRKMSALQTDIQTKLAGKNAKNYDPTLGEFQMNKYKDWLNDGQVGTAYNGPTSLNPGTFDQYQKRIADELNKLQPDMDSMPQGLSDTEKLNYLQIGSKFISKDRVREAINGLTNGNDKELISAHAWRNMSGVPDIRLVGMTTESYNSKLTQMQDQYNKILHDKNLTKDFAQAERYQQQLDALTGSIKSVKDQRNSLISGTSQGINEEQRQALRDNLYFDAFKENYANARAYTQNKTELKFNQAQAFKLKEARAAYQFAITTDLAKQKLGLQKEMFAQKQAMMGMIYGSTSGQLNANGIMGPAAQAPLQLIPVKGDDANVLNADIVKNADANYVAQSQNFYNESYNYLSNNPAYQKYLIKGSNGNFIPKDESSRSILEQALTGKIAELEKMANVPMNERKLTIDDKDQNLLRLSQNLQDAKLYQEQIRDLQNQVFQSIGQEAPDKKLARIDFNDGSFVNISYAKLKQMMDNDDPKLKEWQSKAKKTQANSNFGILEDAARDIWGSFAGGVLDNKELADKAKNTSLYNSMRDVNDYYDNSKVNNKWKEVSQTMNPYGRNVSLPKIKGQGIPPALTGYFADKVRAADPSAKVKQDDIDLNKIWVRLSPDNKNKVQYMAEVKYHNADSKSGDKLATVDLTTDVLNDPNSFVARLYPQDNAQIIYGFTLDKEGKTPFNAENAYADALKTTSNPNLIHKYQIVANKNSQNGLESFSMNVLIPRRIGNDIKYFTVPVKNTRTGGTTTFPANYQYVTEYMNTYFQSQAAVDEFYKLHGVPVPESTTK